ncbi:MAG: hypothetical protein ACLFQV_01865 [Vulcanimicrobiota bacterium]
MKTESNDTELGVIFTLLEIGEYLAEVATNQTNPEIKKVLYEKTATQLDVIENRIQLLMEELAGEAPPPNLAERMQEINTCYIEAASLFIATLDFYREFMETCNFTLINEARIAIDSARIKLNRAYEKTNALYFD